MANYHLGWRKLYYYYHLQNRADAADYGSNNGTIVHAENPEILSSKAQFSA